MAAVREKLETHKKRKTKSKVEDPPPQPKARDSKQFTIHKHLICAKSKFFEAACSKLWAEDTEKVVRLPEVKVDAFQAYLV